MERGFGCGGGEGPCLPRGQGLTRTSVAPPLISSRGRPPRRRPALRLWGAGTPNTPLPQRTLHPPSLPGPVPAAHSYCLLLGPSRRRRESSRCQQGWGQQQARAPGPPVVVIACIYILDTDPLLRKRSPPGSQSPWLRVDPPPSHLSLSPGLASQSVCPWPPGHGHRSRNGSVAKLSQ